MMLKCITGKCHGQMIELEDPKVGCVVSVEKIEMIEAPSLTDKPEEREGYDTYVHEHYRVGSVARGRDRVLFLHPANVNEFQALREMLEAKG